MSLILYCAFLLHLLGDYIVQNDWMANNKKKKGWIGELSCQIHCISYTIPFWFLLHSWTAVLLIYATHYLIDRFHGIDWFIAFKNGTRSIENFGFPKDRPMFLTLWLYIIIDNIAHLFCNSIIIYYTQ